MDDYRVYQEFASSVCSNEEFSDGTAKRVEGHSDASVGGRWQTILVEATRDCSIREEKPVRGEMRVTDSRVVLFQRNGVIIRAVHVTTVAQRARLSD